MINDQRRITEMYDEGTLPQMHKKGRGAVKIMKEEIVPIIDPEKEKFKDRVTTEDLKKDYKPFDFSKVSIDKNKNLVQTPKLFRGQLKKYQLKGLRWLDNLFD